MHLIWLVGHLIGFFHEPSVIVITVMVIIGTLLILVFAKVFAKDLLDDRGDD